MRSCLIKAASLVLFSLAPYALNGQGGAKAPSYGDSPSRWDIFAGYSYLGPHDTVTVLQPDRVTTESQSRNRHGDVHP